MLHRLARLLVEQMRRVFTREQHALGDARAHRLQFLQQGLGAKVGERVAALEVKQVLGGLAHAAARRWLGNAVRPEVSKGPPKAENPGLRYLSPNGES